MKIIEEVNVFPNDLVLTHEEEIDGKLVNVKEVVFQERVIDTRSIYKITNLVEVKIEELNGREGH